MKRWRSAGTSDIPEDDRIEVVARYGCEFAQGREWGGRPVLHVVLREEARQVVGNGRVERSEPCSRSFDLGGGVVQARMTSVVTSRWQVGQMAISSIVRFTVARLPPTRS